MNNGDTKFGGPETSRRDFLKVLGVAGAGVATVSCGPPDVGDKLIPYLIPPEDIVPGTNVSYATVLASAGPEPLGVHAWVRDGRVIKLEGNPEYPNQGALSALAQSALQDLYDPDRVPGPREMVDGDWTEVEWDAAIQAAAAAVGAGRTLLLTPPVTGTAAQLYAEWAAAMDAEWVAWEPFGHVAMRAANEIAFGRAEIPLYDLEAADHVVSFGADFMGTWLAPVELAGSFARARSVSDGEEPARLTFVGPRLSHTGQNADTWIAARAGTEAAVALAVAREVARRRGGGPAARAQAALAPFSADAVGAAAGVEPAKILALAEQIASASAPVALPPDSSAEGVYATETHLAVALLNYVSGAIGTTVRFQGGPVRGEAASYADLRALAVRLREGEFRSVVTAGVNPAYSLPEASGFGAALADVANHISLSSHLDETAATAKWILPSSHELESWGDVELRPGAFGLAQPVMRPVFDTRQREDILLAIATAAGRQSSAENYLGYLQAAWQTAAAGAGGDFEAWWHEALAGGALAARPSDALDPAPPLTAAGGNYSFTMPDDASDGMSLVLYPTAQFYDGRGANRSWMQELPDAVTKAVWSSWVELHPSTAEPLGVETGDLVEVTTSSGSVRAPAFVYRGIRPDTVAIPLGQGHTEYGRIAAGRGVNAVRLLDGTADPRSGSLAYSGAAVEITAVGGGRLAVMQGSDTDLDREIAELISVESALAAVRAHEVDLTELVEAAWDSDPNSPYRWGMTIDLNACNGCGACVTACYAENNVPTVGEDLCAQGREMSWMQIMRYYKETEDGGFQTVHVPVLCQQCGDAPCEPVCPVYAAYHTPEGLNGQVYNRCVGTRYCSNNCPYKVRRFNWFKYEHPYPLNLQLNPDVTVRTKGVMEKCTFCVQRINRAKLDAKAAGHTVGDGEIVTACMQSCPTQAIHFGNLKDSRSQVSRIAKGPRGYGMLEELNTRPAVTYLKAVTWADVAEGGHGPVHTDEPHESMERDENDGEAVEGHTPELPADTAGH